MATLRFVKVFSIISDNGAAVKGKLRRKPPPNRSASWKLFRLGRVVPVVKTGKFSFIGQLFIMDTCPHRYFDEKPGDRTFIKTIGKRVMGTDRFAWQWVIPPSKPIKSYILPPKSLTTWREPFRFPIKIGPRVSTGLQPLPAAEGPLLLLVGGGGDQGQRFEKSHPLRL